MSIHKPAKKVGFLVLLHFGLVCFWFLVLFYHFIDEAPETWRGKVTWPRSPAGYWGDPESRQEPNLPSDSWSMPRCSECPGNSPDITVWSLNQWPTDTSVLEFIANNKLQGRLLDIINYNEGKLSVFLWWIPTILIFYVILFLLTLSSKLVCSNKAVEKTTLWENWNIYSWLICLISVVYLVCSSTRKYCVTWFPC